MTRISTLSFALALPALAAGAAVAMASKADSAWSPVDYNFVAQANLGAPFQIASGRIAEAKATPPTSATMWRASSTIRKATPHSSDTRSRTAPTQTSRNLQNALSLRSKIICSGP